MHKVSRGQQTRQRGKDPLPPDKSCSLSPLHKPQNPHTPGLFSAETLSALRGEACGLGSPQAVPSSQARQRTNLLTDQEGGRGHTHLQLVVSQRPASWPYIWYAYERQVGHGLSCEERGARPPDLTLKDMIGPCRVAPAHGSVTCKKLVGLIQQTVYPRNKGTDRIGLDADNERVQSMPLT